MRATGDLSDKLPVVLSAGDHGRDLAEGVSPTALARFERTWRTLQSKLAALSTDSIHIVVEGAGHSTLRTDRQGAQVTSEAIEQVAEAVRTDRLLTR